MVYRLVCVITLVWSLAMFAPDASAQQTHKSSRAGASNQIPILYRLLALPEFQVLKPADQRALVAKYLNGDAQFQKLSAQQRQVVKKTLLAAFPDPVQMPLIPWPQTPKRVAMTAKQVFEKFHDQVYTIKTDKALGTGWKVSHGGIITCYHVVDSAATITQLAAGQTGGGEVKGVRALRKDLDFVELAPSDPQLPSGLEISGLETGKSTDIAVGDPLYVIGSPEGLEQTLTEGILSGKRTISGVDYLQLSAAISPGSSGSPVFNKYGEVVGMVTSTVKDGQQLNFAVAIDSLFWARLAGVPNDLALNQSAKSPAMVPTKRDSLIAYWLGLHQTSSLAFAPSFAISVEPVGPINGGLTISKDTMKTWIEAELARSAPSAKLLTDDEQNKLAGNGETTSLDIVRQMDEKTRQLRVTIDTMVLRSGTTIYDVDVSFTRGSFGVTGLTSLQAWTSGSIGYFGSGVDAETTLREAVQEKIKKFADDWCIANK
jgi:S1-C subfamily serine protease